MAHPTPFSAAFERFFDEMRRTSWRLPDAGQRIVDRFIRETRPAVVAVVRESQLLEGDVPKDVLTDASKVVRLLEQIGGTAERKISVMAIALVVVSDPHFDKRVERREQQKKGTGGGR